MRPRGYGNFDRWLPSEMASFDFASLRSGRTGEKDDNSRWSTGEKDDNSRWSTGEKDDNEKDDDSRSEKDDDSRWSTSEKDEIPDG